MTPAAFLRLWPLLGVIMLQPGCSPPASPPESAKGQTSPPAAVAKGVIEARGGLITVVAQRDGLVRQVLVQEGDTVALAQPLAEMDNAQARLSAAATTAALGEKRAQVEVAAAKLAGMEREAARLAGLAAADAATRQDADQAANAARVARGEYDQARQAALAAQAQQRLDSYEVTARIVRAPLAGKVVRRAVASGAWAAASTPLFIIEPNGPRVVRAELDESFSDRVRPGMSAVVTKEFQQGRDYRARVIRVADIFGGPSLEDPSAQADTRVVSVTLELDDAADLRLGQRVLVRFSP